MSRRAGFTIVVVCTGNVARSPMAEMLLGRALRQRLKDGAEDVRVSSAGTLGLVGEPMVPPVRELLTDPAGSWLLDCSGLPDSDDLRADLRRRMESFRARRLEPELLDGADLVLGATREHRSAAVGMAPALVRRAFTLVELARLAAPAAHAALAEWDPGEEGGIEPPPVKRARAVVARASTLRSTVRPLHGGEDDIEDPYGREPAVYERVLARIATSVELIVDGLVGR